MKYEVFFIFFLKKNVFEGCLGKINSTFVKMLLNFRKNSTLILPIPPQYFDHFCLFFRLILSFIV
jgi:hypothetical protein